MEEILELKELIRQHDYDGALKLAEELEEMSKKAIVDNIRNYAIILLLHLIKRTIENRTTRSWDNSIEYAVLQIQVLNRRQKSKGNYLDPVDLSDLLQDAFKLAVVKASRETLKGKLTSREIAALVDKNILAQQAMEAIASTEENF